MVLAELTYPGQTPKNPWQISRGIPDALLRGGNRENKPYVVYTTEAGIAYVSMTETSLLLTFRDNPNIIFDAQVASVESSLDPTKRRRGTQVDRKQPVRLGFSINLKDDGGTRWSDAIHGGLLADIAFDYFEKTQGYNIQQLGFYWDKRFGPEKNGTVRKSPSDNFIAYKEAKKTLMELGLSEEQAQSEAAWETWTGKRIARKHNFTSSHVVTDNGVVSGYFSR